MGEKRKYLEKGTILHLRRENSHHTDDWEIVDRIGEGSSSVCYMAVSGRKMGRLKEFNPINVLTDAGSITDFLAAYRTLEDVKAKNERYQVLNNYIPHYELLYAIDEEDRYTGAYVWTPDDKTGTNFADYLHKVRQNPENMPEQTLANILDIVYTLTDCVCLLHSAGILHLDLKPSNFLVTYNSKMELNTGNISLFDINTITSIEGDVSMVVGTDGYCAPEVESGAAENRSDIYSIGAILFNALVIVEMIPDGIWRDEYYESLDCLVSGSKLIRISESNYSVALRSRLADILRKCLAYRPKDRYDYCEQLMDDLLEARKLIDYKQPVGVDRRTEVNVSVPEKPLNSSGKRSVRGLIKWVVGAVAICAVIFAVITMSSRLFAKSGMMSKRYILRIDEKLADWDQKGLKKEYVMDPAEVGTDYLKIGPNIMVYPSQKLTVPKEMKFACKDWNMFDVQPGSELVIESTESIAYEDCDGPFIVMWNDGTLTIDGVTIYAEGAEGRQAVFVSPGLDETGGMLITFNVIGDMHVSCDYETFVDKGFAYRFEYDGAACPPDFPLERLAIFFEGSAEPYDMMRSEDFTRGVDEY